VSSDQNDAGRRVLRGCANVEKVRFECNDSKVGTVGPQETDQEDIVEGIGAGDYNKTDALPTERVGDAQQGRLLRERRLRCREAGGLVVAVRRLRYREREQWRTGGDDSGRQTRRWCCRHVLVGVAEPGNSAGENEVEAIRAFPRSGCVRAVEGTRFG